jgi:hypothetical protein
MREVCCSMWRSTFVLLLMSAAAFAQGEHQAAVVVNGQTGQASVVQFNGRTYIDVAALAQIANGSLSFHGNTLTLTVPAATAGTSAPAAAQKTTDDSGLSRAYRQAAFEEIATLREWGAAVGYAIQNGYPIQAQWAANYRDKASNALNQASTAASTNGDKSAQQLLSNEFDGVSQWSDRLVEASQNMNTAQYSMSPNSLREQPDTQKLITCWHALGSMLGSGTFQDDSSCH